MIRKTTGQAATKLVLKFHTIRLRLLHTAAFCERCVWVVKMLVCDVWSLFVSTVTGLNFTGQFEKAATAEAETAKNKAKIILAIWTCSKM